MTSRAIPAPSLLVVAVGAAARDSKVYAYTSKFVSCCFLIPALETAVVDIFFLSSKLFVLLIGLYHLCNYTNYASIFFFNLKLAAESSNVIQPDKTNQRGDAGLSNAE